MLGACEASYVPFIKALRKKDLEECVAIINGEIGWLVGNSVLPAKFVLNGRMVIYNNYGQARIKSNYLNGVFHGEYEGYYSLTDGSIDVGKVVRYKFKNGNII